MGETKNTPHTAKRDGFAFAPQRDTEIAIACRPDHLLAYCLNATDLHRHRADPAVAALQNTPQ
ncbi:MAG: hypothetical protein GDA55_06715 [Cellvibrionales bacterium]|nr:hypothetical protein [Cellvibrionales bacterium]